MSQQRKVPSHSAIASHWGPTLSELEKEPRHSWEESLSGTSGVCFACGMTAPLDRAHIVPRSAGGTDAVENLHLLCRPCHHLSEALPEAGYWGWFMEQDLLSRQMQAICGSNPELARRALKLLTKHLDPADLLALLAQPTGVRPALASGYPPDPAGERALEAALKRLGVS